MSTLSGYIRKKEEELLYAIRIQSLVKTLEYWITIEKCVCPDLPPDPKAFGSCRSCDLTRVREEILDYFLNEYGEPPKQTEEELTKTNPESCSTRESTTQKDT